ncbi:MULTISPECIES: TVP38/TMEM64 family protein [Cytobacillus]|uniref:Alkaline phosphatase n=2 Tax=Cytobacillus TaxID=2675230 RepID=A0A160MEX5_9BACI|nr:MULTISPECIES: VTT domain-containing protein [Cytobacillus]MBY0155277.1 TVP38/TMEM64 family protein [Cytobacillus firmus]AND41732.1 alkaline phosphatase [Cytobacillus oceanisediminis 2691]MCM3393024.1 VTT domain-containing protein [Cytobacillus oceanisediminis]MCM3402803.1 VTT domain-containing protein [Cytobacillus oceanisediminis]MCM3529960.1 VTT domain-containing protein [Cytobacillus oceanisediminis]
MNDQLTLLFAMAETAGILAPIAFIFFHIIRQFLFIPVPLVCITGGVLFGSFFGSVFSIAGLMISSILFYFLITKMPRTHEKLSLLRKRWFGEYRNLTVGQVAVLRLIPFIHYHLLNFCLMERNKGFDQYLKNSWITNLPLAVFYTVFGEFISRFTPSMVILILLSLSVLVFVLREKVTVIKWKEFFKAA